MKAACAMLRMLWIACSAALSLTCCHTLKRKAATVMIFSSKGVRRILDAVAARCSQPGTPGGQLVLPHHETLHHRRGGGASRSRDATGRLFVLFFIFQFAFFLFSMRGLFLLFSFAFIFLSRVAHVYSSLVENEKCEE
jgi:hypothetical protein